MATSCPTCSRVNPAEASYCYFDGIPLSGRSSGPLRAGGVPFPHPFVFPSGRSCNNFNQLVLASQENWDESRKLLGEGRWTTFLQELNRPDLAAVSRQAQGSSDPDRGLDELLAALPSEVMRAPAAHIDPASVDLGRLRPGGDARLELAISNQGMRLLWGTVRTDTEWLLLGEGQGQAQLLFQTPHETRVSIRIDGKKLRASLKPLEGKVLVDTNGGLAEAIVKVEVPLVPFPEGVLAGATAPRDIALLAKKHPREAAALFESGAVERWYQANGWTYPVEGPVGSGLGAVQQFFEALGLSRAPVVAISEQSIHQAGDPGQTLRFSLTVSTRENRPVFAHASSSQGWLIAETPVSSGTSVVLPFTIPSVPYVPSTLR